MPSCAHLDTKMWFWLQSQQPAGEAARLLVGVSLGPASQLLLKAKPGLPSPLPAAAGKGKGEPPPSAMRDFAPISPDSEAQLDPYQSRFEGSPLMKPLQKGIVALEG